jgi:hypothetical protein
MPSQTNLFLLLALLLALSSGQQMVAIQSSNETYYSYVPLTTCNSGNSDPLFGDVIYQELDALTIFSNIQIINEITFWDAVNGGTTMMMNSDELLDGGYQQLVYFNSSIETNFQSRPLLLVNLLPDGNLQMFVATPQYQNDSLVPIINANLTTDFDQPEQDYLSNCSSLPQVLYIGNSTFLAFCPYAPQLFIFDPLNSTSEFFDLELSISNVTGNPSVLIPSYSNEPVMWNVVLLGSNGSDTLFCFLEAGQPVSCQNFQQEQSWLSVMADRLW